MFGFKFWHQREWTLVGLLDNTSEQNILSEYFAPSVLLICYFHRFIEGAVTVW